MVNVDWFAWPIAIFFALFVSYFLYRNTWRTSVFWKIAAISRFFSTAILIFLLFKPTVRFIIEQLLKPEIIVYTDISKSADKEANAAFESLKVVIEKELGDDLMIRRVDFASRIYDSKSTFFRDVNSTRIDNITHHFVSEQLNESIVGGVLISDGIFNEGQNPNFQVVKSKSPLWSIGIGDTTQYPDVSIESILCNEKVALGNTTEVEINVKSIFEKNKKLEMVVFLDNQIIQKFSWIPNEETSSKAYIFNFQSNKIGWHTIKAVVNGQDKEKNKDNNSLSRTIEIVDKTKKVHIVYGGAHPDVKCLTKSIEIGLQTEVTSDNEDETLNFDKFDIVVFHGIRNTGLIQQCIEKNKPFWVFSNNKKSIQAAMDYTDLEIQMPNSRIQWQEVQAYLNPNFELFNSEDFGNSLPLWKSVNSPLLKYKLGANVTAQTFQKWNGIKTNFPLSVFSQSTNSRSIWFMGDGIWRWRLQEYSLNQRSILFDEWVANNINWLSNFSERKEPIEIQLPKRSFLYGERIHFEVLSRDATGKLVNSKEIKFTIIDSQNREIPVPIFPANNKYKGVIDNLNSGNYQLKAHFKNNPALVASIGLIIQPFSLEDRTKKADFKTLEKMALKTGGSFLSLKNLNVLVEEIKRNSLNSKRSIIINAQEEMNRLWPLLIVLIILFSGEWFLRKWMGKI